MKNLYKLQERPACVEGEIFEKLFELSEIKRLTKIDMEKYRKSILKYNEVRLVADCARDEGRDKGIEIGLEKGIEKGREEGIEMGLEKGRNEGREEEKIDIIQKCFQKNMPIEDIIFFTGYSEEQINRYR